MKRYLVYIFTRNEGDELYYKKTVFLTSRRAAKRYSEEVKHELCKEITDPCSRLVDFIVFD